MEGMTALESIHGIGVRLANYGSVGPRMYTLAERSSQSYIRVAGIRPLTGIEKENCLLRVYLGRLRRNLRLNQERGRGGEGATLIHFCQMFCFE